MEEQKIEAVEIVNTDTTVKTPADLVALAVQNNFDVDRLSKLMDLQERWQKEEARKAYIQAITEFKKNPPKIIKDMHVEFKTSSGKTSYNHASLGNVVASITEALSIHQMSVNWQTAQDDKIKVTCTITHIAGHSESTTISAPPDASGGKNSIQAIGSTITYLQRYTLLAICGLATNEFETDGRIENGNDTLEKSRSSTLDYLESVKGNMNADQYKSAHQFILDAKTFTDLTKYYKSLKKYERVKS